MSPPLIGSTIRLLGSFNPSIFQPAWFARQELIPPAEADAATVHVIHSQISSFETETFGLQVTADSFEITGVGRPFNDLIRDVVYGTFRILEHTPVSSMGINNYEHFEAPSEAAWHRVGHAFAPKDFWSPLLSNPGMQSLIIRGQREDGLPGNIEVRVEPSILVQPHGIFVLVNNHVVVRRDDEVGSAAFLMDVLQSNWTPADEHSRRIIRAVQEVARARN